MSDKKSSGAEQLSFEQSLARLEEIVSALEGGRTDLESSLVQYEEGVGLLRRCSNLLERAERRIEILQQAAADEEPVIETVDPDSLQSDVLVPGRQNQPARTAKKSSAQSKKIADDQPENFQKTESDPPENESEGRRLFDFDGQTPL